MTNFKQLIAGKLHRWSERLSHEDIRRARKIGLSPQLYRCINRVQRYEAITTVLDVGANKGAWAISMSKCLPTAQIHCFEPVPECLEILRNIAANNSKIKVHQCALGHLRGNHSMHVNAFTPSSSLLAMKPRHSDLWPGTLQSAEIKVAVSCLDDEIQNPSDGIFLKVDVQGFELNVLRGGVNVLKSCALVVCEVLFDELYQGQAFPDDVIKFMRSNGFSVAEVLQQHRVNQNCFISYADIAFIPERLGRDVPNP